MNSITSSAEMRRPAARRAVILLGKRPDPELPAQIAAGDHPRVEYLELARRIGAEVLDFRSVERSRLPGVRWVGRRLGPLWGLAWLGYLRRREFQDIYGTGEDIGMRVALLLRAARWHERLTVVIHHGGTPKRRAFLRRLGHDVYRYIICLGAAQRRVLTEEIGLPGEKVHRLDYWCDHRFYRAEQEVTGDYALSVGMEGRDYPTLQAAAAGLGYRFHVVASGWSPGEGFAPAAGIEARPNIIVGRGYSYRELRDLYAGARFIVLPLKSSSSAVGVTAITEGMAMGKAIIAAASPGILDYVEDGISGSVVPVGDAGALRRAIVDLWERPDRASAVGRRNRAWIEQSVNTDRYVARVAELMGIRNGPYDMSRLRPIHPQYTRPWSGA